MVCMQREAIPQWMKRFLEKSKSPEEGEAPEEAARPKPPSVPVPALMPEGARVNDRNLVYKQLDVVRLIGKQRGPDGKFGTYAIADGKSGDRMKYPLPHPGIEGFDPSHPKVSFFPFDTRAELKSAGPESDLVKATNHKGKEGLWHVPKEAVYQPPHKHTKVKRKVDASSTRYFAKRAAVFGPIKRTRSKMSKRIAGKKKMIMMRGVPGSGKSYLAEQLAKLAAKTGSVVLYSTDEFFMSEGQYKFDPTKLGKYHMQNIERAAKAAENGVDTIIIDNTNIRHWEMRAYAQIADKNGYEVEFVESNSPWARDAVECARRNTHGVPLDKIIQMLQGFEPDPSLQSCLTAKAPWET